jgi:hypothetical protein
MLFFVVDRVESREREEREFFSFLLGPTRPIRFRLLDRDSRDEQEEEILKRGARLKGPIKSDELQYVLHYGQYSTVQYSTYDVLVLVLRTVVCSKIGTVRTVCQNDAGCRICVIK